MPIYKKKSGFEMDENCMKLRVMCFISKYVRNLFIECQYTYKNYVNSTLKRIRTKESLVGKSESVSLAPVKATNTATIFS